MITSEDYLHNDIRKEIILNQFAKIGEELFDEYRVFTECPDPHDCKYKYGVPLGTEIVFLAGYINKSSKIIYGKLVDIPKNRYVQQLRIYPDGNYWDMANAIMYTRAKFKQAIFNTERGIPVI